MQVIMIHQSNVKLCYIIELFRFKRTPTNGPLGMVSALIWCTISLQLQIWYVVDWVIIIPTMILKGCILHQLQLNRSLLSPRMISNNPSEAQILSNKKNSSKYLLKTISGKFKLPFCLLFNNKSIFLYPFIAQQANKSAWRKVLKNLQKP